MTEIRIFPHDFPDKYRKWLPKYTSNDVITIEEHIYKLYHVLGENSIPNEKEDVVMKFFALSL
jgi:hypothetical protein